MAPLKQQTQANEMYDLIIFLFLSLGSLSIILFPIQFAYGEYLEAKEDREIQAYNRKLLRH